MLQLRIGTVDLDPVPPRDAVQRSGGGRAIGERVSITKDIIVQVEYLSNRRLQIASPDDTWVIRADQAAQLLALQATATPFSVTLLGYEQSGTFPNCLFEGDAVFPPTVDPLYRRYSFTLYLGA
jgi:hypothetical protein